MMITDYGYCNYVKKLQYSKYIVHQLKDIVTLCPQCKQPLNPALINIFSNSEGSVLSAGNVID